MQRHHNHCAPAETAAHLCRARGGNFRDELEAHLLHGFVFSTPDAFLMGRPVPRTADISDPWIAWPRAECDAWYVWVGVGHAASLLAMAPYPLPWIGWHRQGRAWGENHWVRTEALNKKFKRFASALALSRTM